MWMYNTFDNVLESLTNAWDYARNDKYESAR